ncbi:chaplin [Streptomyces sp. ICBB 8177]|uniref:chaplin n=1 Tax=Streptomyces sp. ICBB 8177 TaxID=563922 RepID=UPI000D67BD8E|nr:chaplin [Streptomyces sp. ICBB 8177]PWI42971.1 chaplin [Streptomyces sp. ICBB 8177]
MRTAKKAALVILAAGVAAGASATTASANDHHHAHGCSSVAAAKAAMSPGVISGNAIQVPLNVPINLVGNTVNVIGILNPAFGNSGVCN